MAKRSGTVRAMLAGAAALGLMACGSGSETGDPASSGEAAVTESAGGDLAGLAGAAPMFFQSSFRLDANIYQDNGSSAPMTMYRDGRKLRMEYTQPGEGEMAAIIRETEAIMIANVAGQQMAMRMSLDQAPSTPEEEWAGKDETQVRRLGPCTVIGETGVEWENADTGEGSSGTACITSDGIILKATENGRTVFEATRLQRGDQPDALFEVPEGVAVTDMGAMMREAMEAIGQ